MQPSDAFPRDHFGVSDRFGSGVTVSTVSGSDQVPAAPRDSLPANALGIITVPTMVLVDAAGKAVNRNIQAS